MLPHSSRIATPTKVPQPRLAAKPPASKDIIANLELAQYEMAFGILMDEDTQLTKAEIAEIGKMVDGILKNQPENSLVLSFKECLQNKHVKEEKKGDLKISIPPLQLKRSDRYHPVDNDSNDELVNILSLISGGNPELAVEQLMSVQSFTSHEKELIEQTLLEAISANKNPVVATSLGLMSDILKSIPVVQDMKRQDHKDLRSPKSHDLKSPKHQDHKKEPKKVVTKQLDEKKQDPRFDLARSQPKNISMEELFSHIESLKVEDSTGVYFDRVAVLLTSQPIAFADMLSSKSDFEILKTRVADIQSEIARRRTGLFFASPQAIQDVETYLQRINDVLAVGPTPYLMCEKILQSMQGQNYTAALKQLFEANLMMANAKIAFTLRQQKMLSDAFATALEIEFESAPRMAIIQQLMNALANKLTSPEVVDSKDVAHVAKEDKAAGTSKKNTLDKLVTALKGCLEDISSDFTSLAEAMSIGNEGFDFPGNTDYSAQLETLYAVRQHIINKKQNSDFSPSTLSQAIEKDLVSLIRAIKNTMIPFIYNQLSQILQNSTSLEKRCNDMLTLVNKFGLGSLLSFTDSYIKNVKEKDAGRGGELAKSVGSIWKIIFKALCQFSATRSDFSKFQLFAAVAASMTRVENQTPQFYVDCIEALYRNKYQGQARILYTKAKNDLAKQNLQFSSEQNAKIGALFMTALSGAEMHQLLTMQVPAVTSTESVVTQQQVQQQQVQQQQVQQQQVQQQVLAASESQPQSLAASLSLTVNTELSGNAEFQEPSVKRRMSRS
jgi:hypothetical protein